MRPDGPTYSAGPGDLTRWMPVPWSGDAAFCRSGYKRDNFTLALPTYWPTRLPNHVLTLADYEIVINAKKSLPERLAAFQRREKWFRPGLFTGTDEPQMQ